MFDTADLTMTARDRVRDRPQLSNVSIVICTRDRPTLLARAIASIRSSSALGRQVEIVVVEEAEMPREIPDVRYVHVQTKGHGFGYARNIGVSEARGEFLLFVDDDCEVADGWVEALLEPFRSDPEIHGVAGAVFVRDCGLIGYAENILGFPGGGLRYWHKARGRTVPTRFISTCNAAYRRKAVLEAGGFKEDARIYSEDYLLAERVSSLGPCVYAPEAIVYHRPRGRFSEIFRWFTRRGEGDIGILAATITRGAHIRFLLRSSWTLRALLVLGLLTLWPPLVLLLPLLGLAYYGAILWRFRFTLRYPDHRRAWLLVPLVKLTMDCGAEVGRWKGLVSLIRT